MNVKLSTIVPVVLLSAATSAFAAPGFTPQQCDDFVSQPTSLTHAQVEQKLTALEAVGYYPGANDAYYPRDLQAAERKLTAEYQRDCGSRG